MSSIIAPAGPPARWIARDGLPAPCVGHDGMPSYEDDLGKLLVFDTLVAQFHVESGYRFFPSWYGVLSVLAPDGLCPLWHGEGAEWMWRPLIYRMTAFGGTERTGSQHELCWRYSLGEMMHHMHAGVEWTFEEANERADRLLLEHLTPLQRCEVAAMDSFRVRGAKTGNEYAIDIGDGFAILDHDTGEEVVSYCFHPDEWIPHADVALATKLALEDEELEIETLENARMGGKGYTLPRGPKLPKVVHELEAALA